MPACHPEHEDVVLVATLRVDGRFVQARAMRGSGIGEASGLAVVATTEHDVLDASSWLPGRVLVLTGSAITRRTVPVVVKGAHLATFSSLVVIADDLRDLGYMGQSRLPVPVVFVDREADHFWMHRATRLSVEVARRTDDCLRVIDDRVVDVRADRLDRRRRQQPTVTVHTGVPLPGAGLPAPRSPGAVHPALRPGMMPPASRPAVAPTMPGIVPR